MGTQRINLGQPGWHHRRSHFQRLFVWYFLGVLGITFLVTCCVELVAVFLAMRFIPTRPLPIGVSLTLFALPCLILIVTLLFFAWRMGRTIRQPVDELMLAVEKIRQHDLNFTIEYSGSNELGDLCEAFSKLRRELQESLEREWGRQEEMRTMIAALSHDLRTPVTIIQGHIEGLRRSEEGEKRSQRLERYLPVLEASSQQMAHLLNEMLLVSSLEQTSFIIQPQPVLLEEEMERKAQVYRLQAAAHQIEFSFTFQNLATQSGPVALDLHRMEQVLDNLFENALRYTSAPGSISLICTRSAGSFSFLLRDTGCGIAPEDLPHVFEKFYYGRSQTDDNARKAAGLGLYTCKLLVEKHGGTIMIQNRSTGGCEVAVSVPTR